MTKEVMKHKHADLIHAWADGADWNDFNPLKSNDPHRVADWVEKILKERNT